MEPRVADEILARLPDAPKWVSARGMLLDRRGVAVGRVSIDPPAFVVARVDGGLAAIVGTPAIEDIRAAAARAEELIVADEDLAWTRVALPGATCERAQLYTLPPRMLGAAETANVRLIGLQDLLAHPELPMPVREELEGALGRGELVGAAFDGETAVSFCCADARTESLWDVSIETLPAYRRRGFATRVARFMIAEHEGARRHPVWGAAASNPASATLAAALGFHPIDLVWVVSR